MTERPVRIALVVLLAVNGLTMVHGAIFVVPTLPREWIIWGPFTDYTVPALALGLTGVLSLLAAVGVVSTPALGALAAVIAGLATMAFEGVEVLVVGIALVKYPDLFQSWLQPIYFTVGLAIAGLGAELYRRHRPERRLVMRSPA